MFQRKFVHMLKHQLATSAIYMANQTQLESRRLAHQTQRPANASLSEKAIVLFLQGFCSS
jgi:hypothetical protein